MRKGMVGTIALVVIWVILMGFGYGAKTASAASGPIVIGVPIARAYPHGISAERAITLASEEINGKGGVTVAGEKRPFKIEIMDTRDLEPTVPVSEALLVVEKLILEKKADFFLGGPIRTEAYHSAMGLFSRYKKVSIIPAGVRSPATGKLIADNYDKYKYSFRNQGHAGVDLFLHLPMILKELKEKHGFTKSYIMVQDVAWARAAADIVAAQLPKWGWETPLGKDVYSTGATDYSVGLHRAKEKGTQVLLIWMDHPEVFSLVKQWHDLKIPALPLGTITVDPPGSWKTSNGTCAYTVVDMYTAGNVPTKVTPWADRFVEAFTKRWGEEPAYFCASSYMSVYLLKDAIERAGTINSDAVVTALEKTDLKDTVYGRIRFDPKTHDISFSHDPAEGAVGCWFQWQEGKRVAVFPPAVAVGKIQLPPWMKK